MHGTIIASKPKGCEKNEANARANRAGVVRPRSRKEARIAVMTWRYDGHSSTALKKPVPRVMKSNHEAGKCAWLGKARSLGTPNTPDS